MRHFNSHHFRFLLHLHHDAKSHAEFPISNNRSLINGNGSIAFSPDACKACWRCIRTCPTQVIAKSIGWRNRHAVISNPANCISCGACAKVCPMGCFMKNK